MPAATCKLYDMVTDFFSASVYPVEPYLLYSTDNTTEYIFEGTQKKFVPNVLTTNSSISKQGMNAVSKCKDNKSMSGMHVKLMFTFSAMGTCFPLVWTVTGLTEQEMPTGEEFLHVRVPGLCIGGGGVNINNQEVSHLLFMRTSKGAETKRFRWYQQEILMPGTSEVVSKTILMGQPPGLSFYVPVVRSIITLIIPYIILKKDVAIVLL